MIHIINIHIWKKKYIYHLFKYIFIYIYTWNIYIETQSSIYIYIFYLYFIFAQKAWCGKTQFKYIYIHIYIHIYIYIYIICVSTAPQNSQSTFLPKSFGYTWDFFRLSLLPWKRLRPSLTYCLVVSLGEKSDLSKVLHQHSNPLL